MKKGIIVLITLHLLIGCCGLLCERQKHAETIIEKVEAYKLQTGKLPENVEEMGIDDNQDHLSFYKKKGDDEYEVWYGLELGTSKIYNSKTKKWRKQ